MTPALLLLLAAPWTFSTHPEDAMGRPETTLACVVSDDKTSTMCLVHDTRIISLAVRTTLSLAYVPNSAQRLLVRLDDGTAERYRVTAVRRSRPWTLAFDDDETSQALIRALLQAPRRVRIEVQHDDGTSRVITFHTQELP